jgi:hypothetical protein
MSRKLRIEYPGATYHVVNRGDQREQIIALLTETHIIESKAYAFEECLFPNSGRCCTGPGSRPNGADLVRRSCWITCAAKSPNRSWLEQIKGTVEAAK